MPPVGQSGAISIVDESRFAVLEKSANPLGAIFTAQPMAYRKSVTRLEPD
jgi:hypothetical protein